MLVRGATLTESSLPLPLPLPLPTMQPFDATSTLSATPAEGSNNELRWRRRQLGGAASSPSPPRGTRATGGESGPAHVKASHVPAPQCNEGQQQHMLATLAASASSAAVEPTIRNRKRLPPSALPSVATATTTTTTSSVDQPTGAVLQRFAWEVSSDAVFRRVRLGPEAEVAYHTTITIAGHVFRGVLYDVGPHGRGTATSESETDGSGEGSSSVSTAGGSCLDLTLRL